MQEILFKKIIIAILALTIGVLVGISLEKVFWRRSVQCLSKLHLIKPNLDCDSFDDKAETLSTLQNKLEVFIDGIKKTGKVKRVGVFVRDLRTSHFAGVNDNDAYYMASLLKTPLLIGGFKLAEVEPKILDQEIVYNGKPNLYDEQVIQVEDKLKVGSSYTIKELMERSVENSDNTAAQILFDYYPAEFMDRILQALGIQIKKPTGEVENLITARTYGSNIFSTLNIGLQKWSNHTRKNFKSYIKGMDRNSEHFGIFQSEDGKSEFNYELLDKFSDCQRILVAGQAKSHCVATSLKQMFMLIQDILKKLFFLQLR